MYKNAQAGPAGGAQSGPTGGSQDQGPAGSASQQGDVIDAEVVEEEKK
jgi:hypothetical protein